MRASISSPKPRGLSFVQLRNIDTAKSSRSRGEINEEGRGGIWLDPGPRTTREAPASRETFSRSRCIFYTRKATSRGARFARDPCSPLPLPHALLSVRCPYRVALRALSLWREPTDLESKLAVAPGCPRLSRAEGFRPAETASKAKGTRAQASVCDGPERPQRIDRTLRLSCSPNAPPSRGIRPRIDLEEQTVPVTGKTTRRRYGRFPLAQHEGHQGWPDPRQKRPKEDQFHVRKRSAAEC